MSWALWLLGDVEDSAIARMGGAPFQRADATSTIPRTRGAYACYYASVLHALRGETAIALTAHAGAV